jgi:nitroreductase
LDIYELIALRKSVRSYRSEPVENEKLTRVLEAARLAPSAANRQEWLFVVVTDAEARKRLKDATKNHVFVGQAPVVIACCAASTDHIMPCGLPSHPIDVAIAIDHLTLAAAAEGLGTCWIGGFYQDKVKEILGIPKDVEVVELLTLGYPTDPAPMAKNRRPLKDMVRYERWS